MSKRGPDRAHAEKKMWRTTWSGDATGSHPPGFIRKISLLFYYLY